MRAEHEDEEQAAGFDTSRLILLGVLALIVLALVVGAIWFVANQTSDEPEADGSVIAAPDEPYKSKPEDPGGKEATGGPARAPTHQEPEEGNPRGPWLPGNS